MSVRPRPLLACILLGCAVHGGAAAADPVDDGAGRDADWSGGFALAGLEAWHLQATPLNSGNFLALPRRKATLAALFEGGWNGVTWRARVETQRSGGSGAEHTTSHATLQELNRVFDVAPGVSLSLGKRLYALDPSFVNQPLGFLQKQTDLADPLDELGQSEGLPMAVLAWNGERASVAAIHSNDAARHADGYNRGIAQSILKIGYEFDGLSASAVLRRADGEAHGIGAALSGAPGAGLSWYASAYRAHGTLRPALPRLPGGLPAAPRSRDGQRYLRATAGVVATARDGPRVQVEWAYDGRGLSDRQYGQLLDLVAWNAAAPLPDAVRAGLQAEVAGMLTSQGVRRRYLSVTLSRTVGEWDAGGGVYAGRDDRSAVWHGTATYRHSTRTRLMLSALWQHGSRGSERALSPLGGSIAVRWWWLF